MNRPSIHLTRMRPRCQYKRDNNSRGGTTRAEQEQRRRSCSTDTLHFVPQDKDMQIKSQSCTAKEKPQMVAKRFFHKTFRNIKSFLLKGYLKLPRNPFSNPLFSNSHKIGPRLQETDDETVNEEKRKGEGQCGESMMSTSDQSQMEVLKEQKKARKRSGELSFLATEKFAQKMEELEMMDENNGDHVMDVEEVIHQYSLLTSPAYLDIVDNFFKDVYLELYLPQPSRTLSGTMRKVGSGCARGSMRKVSFGSGSDSVRGSMRKVSSDSVHGSMRKVGSGSLHGSMRRSGSTSAHGSMRKLGSDSVHGSMRNLRPLKL